MAQAGSGSSSGQGGVIRTGSNPKAQTAVIHGEGEIIRKDGTRTKFKLVSDPLPVEQAEAIIQKEEEKNGSNTPHSST
jgi:hypothetical protein